MRGSKQLEMTNPTHNFVCALYTKVLRAIISIEGGKQIEPRQQTAKEAARAGCDRSNLVRWHSTPEYLLRFEPSSMRMGAGELKELVEKGPTLGVVNEMMR